MKMVDVILYPVDGKVRAEFNCPGGKCTLPPHTIAIDFDSEAEAREDIEMAFGAEEFAPDCFPVFHVVERVADRGDLPKALADDLARWRSAR